MTGRGSERTARPATAPGWRRALANLRWASHAPRRCGTCARFDDDPTRLERAFGNLAAMSSGFGSVRDRDGLCRHRGLYLPAGETCPDHEPRARPVSDGRVGTTASERRRSGAAGDPP